MATGKEKAGDHPDDVESVEEEETGQDIASSMMKFPNIMTAMQGQRIAEILANLPSSHSTVECVLLNDGLLCPVNIIAKYGL
ncbi:hypothetical protein WA026_018057 [Henosepilachna vigintioctopunctata]|uniref:Uncharacterized protein n=1 Tax=Henosepilachna vigintioctopunctata TaxID=420089 RepID=A0AAW1UM39_9CUCU